MRFPPRSSSNDKARALPGTNLNIDGQRLCYSADFQGTGQSVGGTVLQFSIARN